MPASARADTLTLAQTSPGLLLYALLLALLLGICLGSFLNCVAYRYTRGESALRGRSRCPHCGHTLAARDLIPVLSFALSKGKCRYCGAKLSRRYPAAELGLALCLVAILLRHGLTLDTLCFWVLVCILFTVSLIDWESQIIPDQFLALALVLFYLSSIPAEGNYWYALGLAMLASAAISVPLLFLVLLADKILGQESMGGGDIKLFFVCGLFFDWPVNLLMLLVACILGLIFAKLVARAKPGTPFPFGPAIAASCFLMMLFGPDVVSWYLKLFGI